MVKGFEYEEEGSIEEAQALSIKEIVLRHVRKISDISSQEFTGGYWEKRPVKTASGVMFMEVYHEDVREAYCNAVGFLVDMIYPAINKDDKLKKYFEENEKEGIEEKEIKEKLKIRRNTFRQINLMFERINYFDSSSSYSE